MIQPVALTRAHMECRLLKETVPVLTELLAFQRVAEGPGEVTLKHPNSDWLLIVHEGGLDAPDKQMHNHFGVRVATNKEVDAAHEYLTAHKDQYGIKQIGKPYHSHGSYSLYFLEPGTNGWEIECYESVLRKESGWSSFGGVRAPHWDTPLTPEHCAGRAYVPQAFTHGTLACHDMKVSREFYSKVLGLETYRANENVVYVKHPKDKWYVVCAVREGHKNYSPDFRFTIAVDSKEAVAWAHAWLADSGKEQGVAELREIGSDGMVSSFLLKDPDGNWWEVSSPN